MKEFSKITPNNVIDIFLLAELYHAEQLKAQTMDYITTHALECVATQSWKNMISKYPDLCTEIIQALASKNSQITHKV